MRAHECDGHMREFLPEEMDWLLTIETESRAAMATISAQETMPGQASSTSDLISSITLNPLTELLFGPAVFSPLNVGVIRV